MPHVLVIEDDPRVRGALVRSLSERGYATSTAATAMSGLDLAERERPDVVVLDLGLPDMDGRRALTMLRAVSRVPVIVSTARDEEADMVAVLDAGADDYLVKPYGAAQLDARIRAVLRRLANPEPAGPIVVGDLSVDPGSRRVTLAGQAVDLTPKEFELLAYLAERAGQVVSRRELLAEVWRLPYGGADKTVDVHLSWLRRKLGETGRDPGYLRTVRGVGVTLAAPEV